MITQRKVLSRVDAEAQEFDESTLVLSMYGSEDTPPHIKGKAIVFQFQFDDVDEHEEGDEKYIHMTDFMARSFANTIMHHDNLPEKFTLVTHCHAGICRSSAVMQAALEYLFGINSPVIEAWFKTGRYVPNTWVRKKMRKAFTELKENPGE